MYLITTVPTLDSSVPYSESQNTLALIYWAHTPPVTDLVTCLPTYLAHLQVHRSISNKASQHNIYTLIYEI